MQKLAKFQPALVTKEFFPEFINNPRRINFGRCFIWAYVASQMFENVELWDTDMHAFVRYMGKFYDSETLNGTVEWQELPIVRDFGYTSASHEASPRSLPDYFSLWEESREQFNVNWSEIDRKIEEIVQRELLSE